MLNLGIGESGGTGRRAGLRIQWATMGVQLPPLAPNQTLGETEIEVMNNNKVIKISKALYFPSHRSLAF